MTANAALKWTFITTGLAGAGAALALTSAPPRDMVATGVALLLAGATVLFAAVARQKRHARRAEALGEAASEKTVAER